LAAGGKRVDSWSGGGRVLFAAVIVAGMLFSAMLAAAVSYLLVGGLGSIFYVALVPVAVIGLMAAMLYRDQVAGQEGRVDQMMRVHLATIEALALAIDAKDPHTHGHARRVQAYTLELARWMRIPDREIEALRAAALLHDIGKLAIPDHLLHKPGRLSQMEYQKVKVHPAVAAEILANVEFPWPVLPAVRHHHERWDGSGYPDGLKGKRIPVGARILAVADVFEALTSERVYRHRRSPEEACSLIEAWSEIHFDPEVVRTLRAHLTDIVAAGERPAGDAARRGVVRRAAAGSGEADPGAPAQDAVESGDRDPAATDPDAGGFGETLHLGIQAAGRQAGRRRGDAPGPPGPIWLERDSDGSVIGRRAAAFSDISSAHREVYTLYEIAQTLGASLRLAEILELVVHKIGQVVPYHTCVFHLLDDSKNILTGRVAVGFDAEALRGRTVPVGEGITGWAAAQRASRFSDQPELDLQGTGADPSQYSSAAAFPLVHEGRVLGVITLYFPAGVPCLDDHVRMMDIIARLTASAVHNSTVFAESQESALTDALTNLPNSRYLRQVFEQEKVRSQHAGQPMAMLELDLDNFKSVNDRHGHHVGDRYLSEISRVLRGHLRERDVLVRLSGDEFAAILPLTGFAQAAVLAERLQQAVEGYLLRLEAGGNVRGGISVGIALYPHDAENFDDLLVKADLNMYQNKAVRKNQKLESPPNLVPFPLKAPRSKA
jgi:diguanylate cyclase (GGDEF)-like protein/putative nucleotidyltransferase with HDIG domain